MLDLRRLVRTRLNRLRRGSPAQPGQARRPNLVSVAAHWAGAWLILLALYFGLSAVYGSGPREDAFVAHAHAGLTVLGLVVIRLFLRTMMPWPKAPSGSSGILHVVAEAMHWTLYGLMILTPLTGWIVASSMQCCMGVPGLPDLDALGSGIPLGHPARAMAAYHVHVLLVWSLLSLISLHVLAALAHHFIFRDPILVRMFPALGSRTEPASASLGDRKSSTSTT
ncbi:cytochrome b [Bradyrhizobium stylosanthis]|uniref:Cytochrome b561 n=1 Tax=Bradyrhizobium stylosanthis TaxID=1803665 RepID=A0A560DJI3_9BRAD|nr:cytochrome b/b6 domain-containing protein [Bradyrhizobium stylosanthis]TWA97242.1 cytochrome b561 [Bradyrhizobium stylosanthis]